LLVPSWTVSVIGTRASAMKQARQLQAAGPYALWVFVNRRHGQ
jgi:hypothetical protein